MSQPNWPEEGRRPNNPDQFGQSPNQQWNEQPPPPSGMSGGMKACLIIICVLGVCCLVCCGIFGYGVYSFVPKMSENPADVDAARNEIATIDLPAGFKPKALFKFDNFLMSMPMVVYEDPAHATLMMMQIKIKYAGAEPMQAGMRQQFEQRRTVEVGRMENSKTETKTIKIKGKDCPFVITTGEVREAGGAAAGGKKPPKKTVRHQMEGSFEGKDGQAVIVIDFDDTHKEADMIKMLENIK
jgi:hypothetical protein